MGRSITAAERNRIEDALRRYTLFDAARVTKRPVSTLAKIADLMPEARS